MLQRVEYTSHFLYLLSNCFFLDTPFQGNIHALRNCPIHTKNCNTLYSQAAIPVVLQLLSSHRRDGVVGGASASQSVDLGFIPLVESYRKTLKNGIYSFPAWCSAFMGGCEEQAGNFSCCVLGQDT